MRIQKAIKETVTNEKYRFFVALCEQQAYGISVCKISDGVGGKMLIQRLDINILGMLIKGTGLAIVIQKPIHMQT